MLQTANKRVTHNRLALTEVALLRVALSKVALLRVTQSKVALHRVMLVMVPTGTDTFPGVDVMLTSGNSAVVCRHGRARDQPRRLSVHTAFGHNNSQQLHAAHGRLWHQ